MRQGLWALSMRANWRTLGNVVQITAPSAGTEFLVGVAQSTTVIAGTDGDYELSFDSDFANIRGTITVAAGTGTGDVTAAAGDTGETTLSVREVGGSTARATLACTVAGDANTVLLAGARAVREWFEADAGITQDDVSIAADPTGWAGNWKLTPSGSGPWQFVASDTVSNQHYIYTTSLTAGMQGAAKIRATIQAVGAQRWAFCRTNQFAVSIDMIDGYCGQNYCVGTVQQAVGLLVCEKVGDTVVVEFGHQNAASWGCMIGMSPINTDGLGAPIYVAATSDGFIVHSVEAVQERVGVWADQSKVTNPVLDTLRGADLTQATDASQPSNWMRDLGSVGLVQTELGRAAWLPGSHADVLATVGGATPDFAMACVGGFAYTGACPRRYTGAGSAEFKPVYVDAGELKWFRDDGSASVTKTWGSGLGGILASGVPFAVVALADGSAKLFVDHVEVAAITGAYAGLGAATYTGYTTVGDGTSTADEGWLVSTATYAGAIVYANISGALRIAAAKYEMSSARRTVLPVGDSLTLGRSASSPHNVATSDRYVAKLQAACGSSYSVRQDLGVGSQQLNAMETEWPTKCVPLVDPRGTTVVIWGGINDLAAGQTDAQTLARLWSLVAVVDATPGVDRIVVCTITPDGAATAPKEAYRVAVNAAIRTDAAAHGCVVADFAANEHMDTQADTADTDYFSTDLVHMVELGNDITAALAAAQVTA